MGAKGACAVKAVIRVVYIALVGLIVFTGALLIAQGLKEPKPPERQDMPPAQEIRLDTPELTL